MRDPKRIDKILEELKATWHKYPDQRLCQLLLNVLRPYLTEGMNLFYIEDSRLFQQLERINNDESPLGD